MRDIYRTSDESVDVDKNVVRSYARDANSSISPGEFPVQET